MQLILDTDNCSMCDRNAVFPVTYPCCVTENMYLLQRMQKMITHPALMAGKQRQETDLLTPQWLYYQSNGSVTDCNIKKEMDVLMRKWTKGKLGGKELDRLIKEFLQKKDCPVRKITMLEKAVCVFPSEKELPDYTKTLAKREKIYQFIGVYTGGQQDENGRLLCEYWEVAIG